MESQMVTGQCPHCGSHSLEENDQANIYCLSCGRVQESLAFSGGVTFANQKMDGQVVDLNGTVLLTQKSTTEELLRRGWLERRPKWKNCVDY